MSLLIRVKGGVSGVTSHATLNNIECNRVDQILTRNVRYGGKVGTIEP